MRILNVSREGDILSEIGKTQIEVIIFNIMLVWVNGLETLRRIKETNPLEELNRNECL